MEETRDAIFDASVLDVSGSVSGCGGGVVTAWLLLKTSKLMDRYKQMRQTEGGSDDGSMSHAIPFNQTDRKLER